MFRNASPSNLRGSLLEGNKDHLLNQAKSDLAKQELHVEFTERTKSRREQVRLQEEFSLKQKVLRDTLIRSMHEVGEMKRAQVEEVSVQKSRESHETIQPEMARELIDCNISNYVPFVVPGLSASSSSTTPSPTSPSSSSQESVFDVNRYTENPVPERSGSTSGELRGDPLHETTETEHNHKNGESVEFNCVFQPCTSRLYWV